MKQVFILFVLLVLASCGTDDCRTCLGNSPQNVDSSWTICDNGDGTVTNTNNVADTSAVVNQSFAAAVAFFESLNLTCE